MSDHVPVHITLLIPAKRHTSYYQKSKEEHGGSQRLANWIHDVVVEKANGYAEES